MDFNFKKLANDASGLFTRAKQYTEEKIMHAEKTELDAHFAHLLQRAELTELHTKKLLACIEGYLQPNLTVRAEELLYDKLELKKDNTQRPNNLEHLSQSMAEAGQEFGASTAYGSALIKVAATEARLGAIEHEFVSATAAGTLMPIRRFLEGDMKAIQRERKVLQARRLDLDAAKSKLRKTKTVEAQATAEADLRVAQAEFDKQVEISKLLCEGIQQAHNQQLKSLREFVDAQSTFYAQAAQNMADLQRELSGDSNASSSDLVIVSGEGNDDYRGGDDDDGADYRDSI